MEFVTKDSRIEASLRTSRIEDPAKSDLSHKDEDQTTSVDSSHDLSQAAKDRRKKYSVIPLESREKLVDLVLKKRMKIKEAAKMCNLKFSTSKAILATYRKEGRVGKKKTRARKTKVINTLIVAEVNPFDPSQTKLIPMMSVSETKLMPNQTSNGEATEGECHKKGNNDKRKNAGSTMVSENYAMKSVEMSDSMKQMLEITNYSSRVNLLNDIQTMVFKLNATSALPNPALHFLQNALQNLNSQYKTVLDGLVCKRKYNNTPVGCPTLPGIPQMADPMKIGFKAVQMNSVPTFQVPFQGPYRFPVC
jgi:hypothetical protein